MADSGKDASFSFDETLYDGDDCLQSWSLDDAINEVVYQCNGYDKSAAGTRTAMFNASLALSKDDTTKVSTLEPGSTGAFEAHPGGDSTSNIEVIATDALIVSANKSTGPNSIILIDVSIRLQDVTLQAAT